MRRNTPLVSVIISALNEEQYLPKLLNTLVGQTCQDFEVIVVDGQSSDLTVSAATKYAKKLSLTVLVSPERGLPFQRNYGAKHAKGEWLVFSDADNLFFPYSIERIKAFVTGTKTDFFTTWISSDSDNPNETIVSVLTLATIEGGLLLKRPFSPGPFIAMKARIFASVGGFSESATWGEDMEFSTRVSKAGIRLDVLRESIYIWSMRRLRKEGKLKVLTQFARASIYALVTNKALTNMSNYIMGGQLYTESDRRSQAGIRRFEEQFKRLIRDFFE